MENLLRNNSGSMNTVVETFIIAETAELIYDGEQLEKWNKYIEELGLTGQTQIVKKDKSPIPFMHLKKGLVNVFETLCPRKVDVTEYNVTPIPVEILDLIALSKREVYFEKMQIWYDDQQPDPVCIGFTYTDDDDRKKGYTWKMEAYLLGKWGDARRSFEELTNLARKRFTAERKNECLKIIKQYQRELDDIETIAFDRFGENSSNDLLPF